MYKSEEGFKMKTYKMLFAALLVVALAAAAVPSFAVNDGKTAEANGIGAEVMLPIAISKTHDLDFGAIAPTGTAGTVTVATAGTRTASNVNLLTSEGSAAATFDITGEAEATYTIVLPEDGTVLLTATEDDSMAVNDFSSTHPALNGASAVEMAVGAVLSVAANQAKGIYSGTFDVSVYYN